MDKLIPYNTSEKQLKISEYGRHIQKLIDYCVSLPDKEERTKCANTIANLMDRLFKADSNDKENINKIWDHINYISDFKLDIEFPCEVANKEEMNPKPAAIPYCHSLNRFRNYGRNTLEMIKAVADMENCIEKDQMIFLIANQMKKSLVTQNPDSVSDQKIFNDIKEISGSKIEIDSSTYKLNDYIGVSQPTQNKKRKKTNKK